MHRSSAKTLPRGISQRFQWFSRSWVAAGGLNCATWHARAAGIHCR